MSSGIELILQKSKFSIMSYKSQIQIGVKELGLGLYVGATAPQNKGPYFVGHPVFILIFVLFSVSFLSKSILFFSPFFESYDLLFQITARQVSRLMIKATSKIS